MKRNNVIFKVKPDWGGNVIVLLAILYLLYLVEIWEIKRLINNPESLYAILVSIIIIYFCTYQNGKRKFSIENIEIDEKLLKKAKE